MYIVVIVSKHFRVKTELMAPQVLQVFLDPKETKVAPVTSVSLDHRECLANRESVVHQEREARPASKVFLVCLEFPANLEKMVFPVRMDKSANEDPLELQ